jgi:osmotically-inducible protein OsmY
VNPVNRGARTVLVFALLAFLAGCDDREAASFRKVGAKTLAKVEALAGEAGSRLGVRLEETQAKVDHFTVPARVRARLRWDQALAGADVQVQADGAAVTLTGTVRTDEQRRRAVELAQSTAGVTAVTERLAVAGKGE